MGDETDRTDGDLRDHVRELLRRTAELRAPAISLTTRANALAAVAELDGLLERLGRLQALQDALRRADRGGAGCAPPFDRSCERARGSGRAAARGN